MGTGGGGGGDISVSRDKSLFKVFVNVWSNGFTSNLF
jgi:hypothetical protein